MIQLRGITVVPAISGRLDTAQNRIDKACMRYMDAYVPVALPKYDHAGRLRDSAQITSPGVIGYRTPDSAGRQYAEHQYYDELNHARSGNPNAQRLWFEVMKHFYKDAILREVKK